MKTFALIINILGIPTIGLIGMLFITSPMMFASPNLAQSKSLWALIACMGLLLVLLIFGEYFGWKYYLAGDYTASLLAYKWALLNGSIVLGLFYTTFKDN